MDSPTTRPARRGPDASERALRRTIASRFRTRIQRGYVRGKLAGDPVYPAIARLLEDAAPWPLLDIGCGMGLLGQYLEARGLLHGYLGIDHDPRKIDAARHAAAALAAPLHWQCGGADDLPDVRGHVALLDMLHYLPAAAQAPLLAAAAQRLAPDGLLMIRNVLREPNWRYHLTRAEEFLLHATGWMRVGAQHYPSAAELRGTLEAAGLDVRIEPLHAGTPFNSYLVVGRHG